MLACLVLYYVQVKVATHNSGVIINHRWLRPVKLHNSETACESVSLWNTWTSETGALTGLEGAEMLQTVQLNESAELRAWAVMTCRRDV